MKSFLLIALLAILVACPQTTPLGPTPTGAVSGNVTSTGKTISVVSDDRVTAKLEFPANAVSQDVNVTITPVVAADGAWVTLELAPEGLVFAQPVKLTVILTEGQVLGADGLVYYGTKSNPKPVLTTLNPGDRTLSAELTYFGTPNANLNSRGPRATPNPINANNVIPADRIAAADTAFTTFSNANAITNLTPLLEATRVVQALGTSESNRWLSAAKTRACMGYDAAALVASSTVINQQGQLKNVVAGLLYWNKLIQQLGASCGSNYLELAQAKFDQFIVFFEDEVNKISFDAEKLEQALTNTLGLLRDALQLGFTDVQSKLLTVGANLVPKWRNAAYGACQAGRPSGRRSLYKIINNRLETLYPTLDVVAVTKDLNYCDFNPTAKLLSPLARTLETKTLGGTTPGNVTESWTRRTPVQGELRLDLDLLPTYCPNTDTSPTEVTFLGADGSEIKRWQPAQILSIHENIAMAILLGGSDPSQLVTKNFLFSRSAACNGQYPAAVLSFKFIFDPKPKLLTVTANPTTVQAPGPFPQTFQIGFEDPGANIVALQDRFVLKPINTAGVDTREPYSGMGGASGTGEFTTNVLVDCSNKGNATKVDTFQVQDDLDQLSNTLSFDSSVSYTACQ